MEQVKTASKERLNLRIRPEMGTLEPSPTFTVTTRVLPIYVLSLLNLDESTTIDRASYARPERDLILALQTDAPGNPGRYRLHSISHPQTDRVRKTSDMN